jgi:anti-sigma factor RsiW
MDHESCRHLLGSLSEYVDGDLGDELCAEINRHLQGCENCRIVVDSLRKTVYLYHETVPSPSVPEDVRQRLYHSLDLDEFLEKKG